MYKITGISCGYKVWMRADFFGNYPIFYGIVDIDTDYLSYCFYDGNWDYLESVPLVRDKNGLDSSYFVNLN